MAKKKPGKVTQYLIAYSVDPVSITGAWVPQGPPPPPPQMWTYQITLQATITVPSFPPGVMLMSVVAKIQKQNGATWDDLTTEKTMTAIGRGVYEATFSLMEGQVSTGMVIRGLAKANWMANFTESGSANNTVPAHP